MRTLWIHHSDSTNSVSWARPSRLLFTTCTHIILSFEPITYPHSCWWVHRGLPLCYVTHGQGEAIPSSRGATGSELLTWACGTTAVLRNSNGLTSLLAHAKVCQHDDTSHHHQRKENQYELHPIRSKFVVEAAQETKEVSVTVAHLGILRSQT